MSKKLGVPFHGYRLHESVRFMQHLPKITATHRRTKCITETFLCAHTFFTTNHSRNVHSRVVHSRDFSRPVDGPPAMGPSLQLSTCVLFWGFLGLCVPAVESTKPRSSSVSSQANAILNRNNVTLLGLLDIFRRKVKRLVEDFSPTTQLAAVTLTSETLTLELVHGVLVSQGLFLPSLVFLGLFVFALGGGTGQTDGRTDSIDT